MSTGNLFKNVDFHFVYLNLRMKSEDISDQTGKLYDM
jgi:hypothetical protein